MRELPVNKPELQRLYRTLGEPKISLILTEFYGRLSQDPMIGFFFAGKDLPSIIEMQKAFLLRAMGARPSYGGRPPARAHENLAPILPGHFDRRLRVLEETLKHAGVEAEDIRIWVAFEEAFRNAVVHSPSGP